MIPHDNRCPLDGAPLREWTVPINSDPTYVHTDGTTHGGLLEFAECLEAVLARLAETLAPAMAELNATAHRAVLAVQAIECPRFPGLDGEGR